MWGATEGRIGVEGLQTMSTHVVDGLVVIEAGRAARAKHDAEQAKAVNRGK